MERRSSWLVFFFVAILLSSIILTEFSAQAAPDKKSHKVKIFFPAVKITPHVKILSLALDKTSPTVKILSPAAYTSLPQSDVFVQGLASDNNKGSGVKLVQIRIDNGIFSNAIPKKTGDWSSWSLLQTITASGSHKIEARAIDYAGNQKSSSITITTIASTLADTSPPSITPPPNVTSEATGALTTVTLGTPIVTDSLDPSPIVTNNAPSSFQVGTWIVTWTATDSSGNHATTDQTVTIVDTTSPSIVGPDKIILESVNDFTTVNLGTPTVSDLVDPSPIVTNNAPVTFPIGTTQVIWTVTDFSGNSATASQTVTINESTTDLFGITKIYPTKTGGPKWQMNSDNILNDSQFTTIPPPSNTCSTLATCTILYQNISKNDWHAARIDVPANEGIRMVVQTAPDSLWLNTEMTGYYKLRNSVYYPQEFIHVLRSGTPHASTCQGYSYYAGITFDGDVAKIQKSLYHGGDRLGYSSTFFIHGVTTPLNDRWIGMKTVTYNVNDNTGVKIEIWLDDLADNDWRKVYEQTDNGWSIQGDPEDYGCINPLTGLTRTSNDIILWGGTEQQFRADNAEIDFKALSIREIVPPQ